MKRLMIVAAAMLLAPLSAGAETPTGPMAFKVHSDWDFDGQQYNNTTECDMRRTEQASCEIVLQTFEERGAPIKELLRGWIRDNAIVKKWAHAEKFDVYFTGRDQGDGRGIYWTGDDRIVGGRFFREGLSAAELRRGVVWPIKKNKDTAAIGHVTLMFEPVGEEWAAWGQPAETKAVATEARETSAVASGAGPTAEEEKPWWKLW